MACFELPQEIYQVNDVLVPDKTFNLSLNKPLTYYLKQLSGKKKCPESEVQADKLTKTISKKGFC